MMMKDKKPAEKKGEEKEPIPIIPPRTETPKLLKAALEMTGKTGMKGTWSKLKDQEQQIECLLAGTYLEFDQTKLI